MKPYMDTGVLVKLYYPETESDLVERWVKKISHPILFSSFHELEMMNAVSLKVWRSEITAEQADAIHSLLKKDLDRGILLRIGLDWVEVFSHAIRLSKDQSRVLGTRSLDVLHVSAASLCGCTHFVTTDVRQRSLAGRIGMVPVGIPEMD